MVDFYNEWNSVGKFTAVKCQDPKGGGYAIAACLYGEPYYIFRIEINRVFIKREGGTVLNSLIDRQYAQITGVRIIELNFSTLVGFG